MAPKMSRRASRGKASISYTEPPSDGSDLDEIEVALEMEDTKTLRRSSRSKRPAKSSKRGRSSNTFRRLNHASQQTLKKRKVTRTTTSTVSPKDNAAFEIPASGKKLPWQNLPYQILVQIFQYASYPLYDENTFQSLESSRKLCKIARLCRNFAEPAFTVLYTSPPLVPMDKARKVVDILKANPKSLAFNYRQKVESLRIDVGQVAAYSMGAGLGHVDLHGLIMNLPRLTELELCHQYDMAPYRQLDQTIKWTYAESLFEALEFVEPNADVSHGDKTSPSRLKSWRWSSRLCGKRWPIGSLRKVHMSQPFSTLKKIAFVNYQVPKLKKTEEDPMHEKVLADAISALKSLEHLVFESSSLLNAKLLQLLPNNLRNVEFINCWEITANDFGEFLITHGSQLHGLTLNHNRALSLSFLPLLAPSCPKLQVIRMNLTYFRTHLSYNDAEPDYSKLLYPHEVPRWPSTLQLIDLVQLRRWETETAEIFFQSLLDQAAELPDLRTITIQAILDIPWRERASFREKWIGTLIDVFKRVPQPPRISTSATDLGRSKAKYVKAVRTHGAVTTRKSTRGSLIRDSANNLHTFSRRRSSRSQQAPSYFHSSDHSDFPSDVEDSEDAGSHSPSKIRSRPRRSTRGVEERLKATVDGITTSPLIIDSESKSDPLANKSSKPPRNVAKEKQFIQGMCEVVDLRIDNLRPGENQFTEKDFLDDEPAEDEDPDWDEHGDGEEEAGYAW